MYTSLRPVLIARRFTVAILFIALTVLAIGPMVQVQAQSSGQKSQQPDQAAPDSGGPGGDTGVIAVPKKKDVPEDAPLPPAPAEPKVKNPEELGTVSLRLEVPEVTVDVGVDRKSVV